MGPDDGTLLSSVAENTGADINGTHQKKSRGADSEIEKREHGQSAIHVKIGIQGFRVKEQDAH